MATPVRPEMNRRTWVPVNRFHLSRSGLSVGPCCLILRECGRNLECSSHRFRKSPLLIRKLALFRPGQEDGSRWHWGAGQALGRRAHGGARPCRGETEKHVEVKGRSLPHARWLWDQGSQAAHRTETESPRG